MTRWAWGAILALVGCSSMDVSTTGALPRSSALALVPTDPPHAAAIARGLESSGVRFVAAANAEYLLRADIIWGARTPDDPVRRRPFGSDNNAERHQFGGTGDFLEEECRIELAEQDLPQLSERTPILTISVAPRDGGVSIWSGSARQMSPIGNSDHALDDWIRRAVGRLVREMR